MGIICAVVSDTHINSTIGLCPPGVPLDDGGEYRGSSTQRFLWRSWLSFWSDVAELKARTGYPVMAVFNGDIIEADIKGRSHQLITRNKADALGLVRSVIETPVQLANWCLFIRGTQSHVGKSAWLEEVASDYDNTLRTPKRSSFSWWSGIADNLLHTPKKGNSSWWSWRGMVDNLLIDFQHAVILGGKEDTRPNALGRLALEIEMDARRDGRPVPALAIRSHGHYFVDSYDNYPVRVLTSGAFQGIPEYLYRRPFVAKPHIGALIIMTGDEWTITKKRYPMPREKIQSLPALTGSQT